MSIVSSVSERTGTTVVTVHTDHLGAKWTQVWFCAPNATEQDITNEATAQAASLVIRLADAEFDKVTQ